MSWQACDAIDRLPYDACGPLAYRILQKLANVAAEDGTRAFRHVGAMSVELGVSQRSVQRALKELEHAALIAVGDQGFVGHLRADRRPKVYDINMRAHVTWSQPEIYGVTQLSTDSHGVTNGVTTAVALEEQIELTTTKTSRGNQTSDVTPLPGDVAGESCPASLSGGPHVLGRYGKCIECHARWELCA